MDTVVEKVGDSALMRLSGRFDFNAHRNFREAVDKALSLPEVTSIGVDLAEVTYLDSSALGMLLMLRDKGRAGNRAINLLRAGGSVKQVLEIANFAKLFNIVD
ncbi:MAG: STAS domain-containing protein [Rhodocyclaceae bacterium]|nr:STAS domain-containing protein [Rhodocyclaceae bacterium]MCB1912357.1 STAS domain-containing protein [Rhodocyclaceae bacterium]MCP5232887.1 STAS domain-containing protein [Zoogloeaceae bacterium]MCP5238746.1 STAS domain-containing protein [Zoogloeaceae bacterium]MCP5254367.1 STAS domain-containing protein [Zoogloeaceae bacterium]